MSDITLCHFQSSAISEWSSENKPIWQTHLTNLWYLSSTWRCDNSRMIFRHYLNTKNNNVDEKYKKPSFLFVFFCPFNFYYPKASIGTEREQIWYRCRKYSMINISDPSGRFFSINTYLKIICFVMQFVYSQMSRALISWFNTRNPYRILLLYSSNTEHFMEYHDFRSDCAIRQRWSEPEANTVVIKTIDFDCIVSMILKSVVLMTTSVTRKVCGHNLKRTFASAIDSEDFGVGNDLHRQYRQKIFFFSHETIIEMNMSKMKWAVVFRVAFPFIACSFSRRCWDDFWTRFLDFSYQHRSSLSQIISYRFSVKFFRVAGKCHILFF